MKRRSLFGLLCGLFLSAGLATGAAQAQAPQVTAVPDGMVAIHYFRPAGDYDGWGVHLWESYDKVADGKPVPGSKSRSDKPLDGVTWMAPMKPTGKDGFGIYWQVKADEFRNTKVNFIIHKGDVKDCARDLYFISTQTKQIFVNQGNCDFFTSADEAVKARK
jgi:hypothetical protein